jgi:hypothetical protein
MGAFEGKSISVKVYKDSVFLGKVYVPSKEVIASELIRLIRDKFRLDWHGIEMKLN